MRPLVALVLLAACAAGADAPAPAPHADAPQPAAAPKRAPDARPLKLADAVKMSAAATPVALAKLDAAIARAQLGVETAALLPQVTLGGSGQRGYTYFPLNGEASRIGPIDTFDARARLGLALIDLNLWNRAAAADHRAVAAAAGTALSIQDAADLAARTWLDLAMDQALLDVRRRDVALAADLLTLARAQVEIGVAEPIAVTRAERRLADSRAAAASSEGDTQRAAIALARALTVDPGMALVADGALTEVGDSDAAEDLGHALAQARDRRPELAIGSAQLAAAEADRRAAFGARLPRLAGFADIGRIGTGQHDLVTTWEAGAAITIPIFDRSRADEQAAIARDRQQALRTADISQRVDADVRDAIVALGTSRTQLAATTQARGLANDEVEQARARFAAGAISNLELIDAQRGLAAAEESLVRSQRALAEARVRLARATGVATSLR